MRDPESQVGWFAAFGTELELIGLEAGPLSQWLYAEVFEFSSLLEQQRTGIITRQLAAWAAILAVPTATAGIYGMNFEYMPELKSPFGYFVVLLVIAAKLVSRRA